MLNGTRAAVAAAVVVSLGIGVAAAAGKGRPTAAKSRLEIPTTPTAGPDADARGVVDWKHFPAVGKRPERSWLRFRLGRLDGTDYTVWMDDPSTPDVVDLTQVGTLTANDKGHVNARTDTKFGDTLPFGATLEALQGLAIEIRDANDAAVLVGTVPAPKPHPSHPNHP